MPSGPMVNLFLFKRREKIFVSSVSRCTETEDCSLNGFLKVNIEEVFPPTAVEIGYGSIRVGSRPLPSTLYCHLPTIGFSKMICPDSTASRFVGEY